MFLTSHAFPEIPDEGGSMVEAVAFVSGMLPKAWEECLQRRGLAERPGRVELEVRWKLCFLTQHDCEQCEEIFIYLIFRQ